MTKTTKAYAQQRFRSAWASAKSDQSLRCALIVYLRTQGFFMRTAKTLIRLGGCPGWSESLLGAHSFWWFCHVAAHLLKTMVGLGIWKRIRWKQGNQPRYGYMSPLTRKSVFGVSDQGRLKPACSATETTFACGINRFSRDVGHIRPYIIIAVINATPTQARPPSRSFSGTLVGITENNIIDYKGPENIFLHTRPGFPWTRPGLGNVV